MAVLVARTGLAQRARQLAVAAARPDSAIAGLPSPQPLFIDVDPGLEAESGAKGTQVLLVADRPGFARGWYAAGIHARSPIDGRGLAAGLLPLVYASLAQQNPGLLDQPLGRHLREWEADPRGAITPRQLMWDLSGLAGGTRRPWNPFDPQAQLLAGPDFMRAALAVRQQFPPGTLPVESPANAQLLALLAGRLTSRPYADLLEGALWRRFAFDGASATLDHRRGQIAAHCCITASARDWLGVAMLLSQQPGDASAAHLPSASLHEIGRDHPVNPGRGLVWRVEQRAGGQLLLLRSSGRLLAAAPGRGKALFWSGEGEIPVAVIGRLLDVDGETPVDRSQRE